MTSVGPTPPMPPPSSPSVGVPPGDKLQMWREMISSMNVPVEVLRQMGERQLEMKKPSKKDAERTKKIREQNKPKRARPLQGRTRIID